VASLCHPGFTTTKLSYRFPIFETSATALCGTTGKLFKPKTMIMMIMYKLTQIYPHNAGYPSIPALSASNVLPLENGEVAWLQTWTCVQGNLLPHGIANHLFLFSHTLSHLGFHVRGLPLQPSALHVLMPPEQLLTPLVRPRLGEESDTLSADLVGKLHEVCKFMISIYTWSQTYW